MQTLNFYTCRKIGNFEKITTLKATIKAQGLMITQLLKQNNTILNLVSDTNLRLRVFEGNSGNCSQSSNAIVSSAVPPRSNSLQSLNEALEIENIVRFFNIDLNTCF